MKQKRDIKEVFAEMYSDENSTFLNLFAANLISADTLIDENSCRERLDKLNKFADFISEQPPSDKKTYYEKFVKDAEEIINKSLKEFQN